MTQDRRRIVIDCDPGIDDAVALMVAEAMQPQAELLAVTTVAGNVGGDLTFANARALMHLLDRGDVPVFKGCPGPILHPAVDDASHVHGDNGLGGVALSQPAGSAPHAHAVDYLIDLCRAAEGDPVTLCPIGPLTNIAVALVKAPDMVRGIREIVLMGGAAFVPGNVTPAAEFNIWADPYAAEVVFRAPVAKVMIGLDVTHQVAATPAWIDALEDGGRHAAGLAASMLRTYQSVGGHLHDPCVPVWLGNPGYFDGVRARVSVGLAHDGDFGRTVATEDPAGDVLVLTGVDADAVRAAVRAGVRRD